MAKRRNPFIEIVLYPAIVQGDQAVCSIINGIHALEREGVDVMIVGRGGGSIEDLWAFNHREVAQAVFDCSVPIISAVGHETDTTIIDYVADLRAPTPSAAAELAVCDMAAVVQQLYDLSHKVVTAMLQKCKAAETVDGKYGTQAPQCIAADGTQAASHAHSFPLEEQLSYHMERKLAAQQHRLEISASRLEALSPLAKLKQGYAYVTKEEQTLTSTAQITRMIRSVFICRMAMQMPGIEETYQQSVWIRQAGEHMAEEKKNCLWRRHLKNWKQSSKHWNDRRPLWRNPFRHIRRGVSWCSFATNRLTV